MFSMFALLGITSVANAATLPSTCGTSGTDLCVDADRDGFYADPGASTVPAEGDCNDAAKLVFPGAPAALGDGVKNDCSATGADDDVLETSAALAAACGKDAAGDNACDSTDPKISAPAIARRDAFVVKYESCTLDPIGGVWGVEGGRYTCTKDSMLPGWDWANASGVRSKADNTERSARKAADAAILAQLGHPAVAAVPATDKTPAVEAVPATGLYAELAELEAAIAKADAATKAALEAQKAEVKATIAGFEIRLGQNEAKVTALQGDVRGLKTRMSAVEQTGIAVEGGVSVFMIGQPEFVTGSGDVLRGAITGGGIVNFTIDSQRPGHLMGLDIGLAPMTGSVAVDGGSVPASMASLGMHYQWIVGDIAIGPELVAFGDASNNPLDAAVSGFGVAVGGKFAYYLPMPNPRTRVGLVLHMDGGVAANGTNGNFYPDGVFLGSFGIVVGDGPARY